MNEAILFLEKACQDFKELKLNIGVDKTNTYSTIMKSNGKTRKLDVEMKGIEKKLEVLKAKKLNNGFQNYYEEKFENLSEVKIIELAPIEKNPMSKVIGKDYEIQKQEKQLAHLVLEEKIHNSISKRNKDDLKPTSMEKREFNEKIHDLETSEEALNIDECMTKSEIEINNKQPQIEVNKKKSETLIDIDD